MRPHGLPILSIQIAATTTVPFSRQTTGHRARSSRNLREVSVIVVTDISDALTIREVILAITTTADIPSGAMQTASELEHTTVWYGKHIEAVLLLEEVDQLLLALFTHNLVLRDREDIHRQPTAALAHWWML